MPHPSLMPDVPENFVQQLLAARSGSPDARAWLLENCRPYLLRVANEELDVDLRSKLGASDLVQQSVIEAQRDFVGFAGATVEELLAWLRRILRHNLNDARRYHRETARRRLGSEQPLGGLNGAALRDGLIADITPPVEGSIARERTEALEQAVGRLTSEYRQVLALRYEEDRSFAEIGALLGRSEEATRKLWLRAVRQLRREMRGLHDSN